MVYRTRIKCPAAQQADIWDRWQRGETLTSIGRLFDRPFSSIFNVVTFVTVDISLVKMLEAKE
jgi:hypothetical protein